MATQQAVVIDAPQQPMVLKTIPKGDPGKGEVRVKVLSTGIAPLSAGQRDYNILVDSYPAVLGGDIAGVVDALGEGVTGFAIGDKVCAGTLGYGYQQYAVLPAGTLLRVPQDSNLDDIATYPTGFAAACVGLYAPNPIGLNLNPELSWEQPTYSGKSALVLGGSSVLGQFAIQLLRFVGFTRIVSYASGKHSELLKGLGATECVDRTTVPSTDLSGLLGATFDVVYDACGLIDVAYDCALDKGGVVTALPMVPLTRSGKNITLVKVFGVYYGPDVFPYNTSKIPVYAGTAEHTKFGKHVIENFSALISKGVLKGVKYEILPGGLASIPDGVERVKKGVSGLKLVAHPHDV